MQEEGIIRLALVVADGGYKSGIAALRKLINAVLFDNGDEPLTSYEIRVSLKE